MIEKQSETWRIVQQFANKLIEDGRDLLEKENDEKMRGRIEAARELLELAEDKKPLQVRPPNYSG